MKRREVFAFVVTAICFLLVNFFFLNYFGFSFSPVSITGHVVNDTGIVKILIEKLYNIQIYSPENTTYDFNRGDLYIVPLNVSADFTVDAWKYSLYDLTHNVFVEEDTPFVPNSSISAVRWQNLLTVFAHVQDGEWVNKSVYFYVNVSNSAPIIANISEPVLFCEGDSANFVFNASDIDEDVLEGDISPKNPFYLSYEGKSGVVNFFSIISGVLRKSHVGNYTEVVSVVDPWEAIDSKSVDVEVIEINNIPVFNGIGAQTVWLAGDNSVFNYVADVLDVEDGNASDGNLHFNLSWGGGENLFDIDPNYGFINYTPIVGHEGHVYSLRTCVEDNALLLVHNNISLCSPNSGDSHSVCDDWTLTVTDENRAPEILNHTPNSSLLFVDGTDAVEYSVVVRDPDGTVPDIDWYVDSVLQEHNENTSNDSFVFDFGCGVDGSHSVEINASDGLLSGSFEWFVSVSNVDCPIESSGGGGGGGGQGEFCVENWVCDDWEVCQNVKRSYDSEILSLEDYSVAKDSCLQNKEEDDRFCGFQITSCHDLNNCSRVKPILPKPVEKRFCYFTENPSCEDGITNCHDGGCEVLADCGGPCSACATCSDGVQNQGEEDVDCGGPCPFVCEPEVPFAMISSVLIVVAIFFVILIGWLLWWLFLFWKRKRDEEKS